MAIALAASGSNATAAATLAITATWSANDYLIATYAGDNASMTMTSYGTPLAEDARRLVTYEGMTHFTASGRASSGGTSLSSTVGTNTIIGALLAFSGVDTTTALDAAIQQNSSNTGTTNTNAIPLTLTTTTADAMLVFAAGLDVVGTSPDVSAITINDNGAGLAWTVVSALQASGYRKTFIAYATKPTTGSITVQASWTGPNAAPSAVLYALKPASGGGITGTGAITLGTITMAGTAEREVVGTGAITLGAITVSGAGEREVVDQGGPVELTLPAITVSGSGSVGGAVTGTGSITLGPITVSGTGEVSKTGTGAISLGPLTLSGTAEREVTGSGAITLGVVTLSGSGAVGGDITGTGSISLGPLTVSGTAEREIPGSGAILLGPLAVAGSGLRITEVTGTGSITLGALQVSGYDALRNETQNSGGYGFYNDWEREQARRRRRKKELEEQIEAEKELQDAVEAEIAVFLHEQERKEEDVNRLARLKDMALRYSAQEASSERVRSALMAAQQAQTFSNLQRLEREIERQLQEEEFLLMLLLSD